MEYYGVMWSMVGGEQTHLWKKHCPVLVNELQSFDKLLIRPILHTTQRVAPSVVTLYSVMLNNSTF